jgi:hypothetical protein
VRPTIPGTSSTARAARAVVRLRRSRLAWSPWPMAMTAGARYVSPPRVVGYSASNSRVRALRWARKRASGGAGWPSLTPSRDRYATARRYSTRRQARRSEIPIGRRHQSVLIKPRWVPIPGSSGSPLPQSRGTFTRSIRNAPTRWTRPRSCARTLGTTWRKPLPRSTKSHSARPSGSLSLPKPAH